MADGFIIGGGGGSGLEPTGSSGIPVYVDENDELQACTSIDLPTHGVSDQAKKLIDGQGKDFAAGSYSKPVYFEGGIPKACNDTLGTKEFPTNIIGNASTASKLETVRKINNTDFDGSSDITTAKWGASRSISILGSDEQSSTSTVVDGSTDIKLKLPNNIVASKLTTDTIGSTSQPIYIKEGLPTTLASKDGIGDISKPIYLDKDGVFKVCEQLIPGIVESAKSLYDDTLKRKYVAGDNSTPIYFEEGVPKALSSTIGSSSSPVYINKGEITQCGELQAKSAASLSCDDAGSDVQFIYFDNGVPKASNKNVGTSSKPIYLNQGHFEICADMSITNAQHLTDERGQFYNIGSTVQPVYFEAGIPVKCEGSTLTLPDSKRNYFLRDDGTWQEPGGTYSLPKATTSSLGGVIVGKNLSVTSDGVLSANNSYTLPVASGSTLGGIKVGNNLSVTSDGVLSANNYSLPVASSDTLGGIKVGDGLSIDTASGKLKVTSQGISGVNIQAIPDTTEYYVTSCAPNISQSDTLYKSSGVKIKNNVLLGAAWNDYAEFRLCDECPGTCVVESNDGKLIKSTKRLQKCGNIISDTYGFIIGPQSDDYKPIAVSGRVLAKTNEQLRVGDTVCTGKNGTVSKMSRLEIILFPDRIIGTISEIPNYLKWNNVDVNNRVWVKVK